MKIPDLITAGIPACFSLSRSTDSIPTNNDVLSFIEKLVNDGISRADAIKSVARVIADFKFDTRDAASILK